MVKGGGSIIFREALEKWGFPRKSENFFFTKVICRFLNYFFRFSSVYFIPNQAYMMQCISPKKTVVRIVFETFVYYSFFHSISDDGRMPRPEAIPHDLHENALEKLRYSIITFNLN